MNMKKILVIQPIHEEGINLLKDNSDFEYEVVDNIDTEFLKSKIKDCDGISIRTAKLSGDVIEAANNLKIISVTGTNGKTSIAYGANKLFNINILTYSLRGCND